jgi:ornithine cyclodeaminase
MSHGDDGYELLVLSGADIRALVSTAECVELIDAAMRTVSSGGAILPLRSWVKIPGTANLVGWMPGFLDAPPRIGVKLIGIFPENPHRGLPSHCGLVTLFDPELGLPRAVLDAATVTSMRTAAASAVATRALARSGAGDLAVLGTGEQAEAHLQALTAVCRLRRVRLWGRDPAKARRLAQRAGGALGLEIEVMAGVAQAVAGADVVCTVTAAREPILRGEWIAPGAHVNLVGASVVEAREADEALVLRSAYFVDYRPSAAAQAGELHAAVGAEGARDGRHVRGEIGEVLSGRVPGRTHTDEVTVYKSLGIAAQDLALAGAAYERARALGRGTRARL